MEMFYICTGWTKQVILTQGGFCSSGDTWQSGQTFLIVVTRCSRPLLGGARDAAKRSTQHRTAPHPTPAKNYRAQMVNITLTTYGYWAVEMWLVYLRNWIDKFRLQVPVAGGYRTGQHSTALHDSSLNIFNKLRGHLGQCHPHFCHYQYTHRDHVRFYLQR